MYTTFTLHPSRRWLPTRKLGLFTAILTLFACAQLNAAITCSNADYKGTYAFFTTGYFLQLPPAAAALAGPFSQAGTFTSDGQGNVSIQSTASYNGLIQPASVPATYKVSADCTIAFSLTLPPPLSVPATFRGVLSQNNGQLSLMVTSPGGSTIIGTQIKQYIQSCDLPDLLGAYAIDLEGMTAAVKTTVGTTVTGPFRRIGRVIADGTGNFTATTIADYNGLVTPEAFQGTYTLDNSCVVTLNYANGTGGANINITGSLAGVGQFAMVMITTPGWSVSGTLKAVQQ